MLNFLLMDFWLLPWEACALAYKAQRLKMQKLAYWKPALSIRKQNSSHLQDFCNAFSTKDCGRYCTFVPPVIDDSSLKNVTESFTVALTLTLGGVRKCNSARLCQVSESEQGQPRPQRIFSQQEEGENVFKNFSGDEVENKGVFVAINITISTFPRNFPERLKT